jgi:stage II sporulation protein D
MFPNSYKNICLVFLITAFAFIACTPIPKKMTVTKSPEIRVLLNEISKKDSLTFKGEYKLISEEAEYAFGTQNRKIFIKPGISSLLIYNDFRYLEYQKTNLIKVLAATENSYFTYRGSDYSGDLILAVTKDSIIQIINELPLEEYLRGVVPAEIYTSDIENIEAVKAQTICARTYAINRMNERRNNNFHVYGDSRDQVYKGLFVYHLNADKAINETRGVILSYMNQPAVVYYHSTCGGKLEAVENVFSPNQIKYLSGGTDAISDVISCSASPKFRWQETRTIDQIDSTIQLLYPFTLIPDSASIKDTTTVSLELSIAERTNSGRVKALKLIIPDTTLILENYQIRRILGKPGGETLPSTLFYLSQENDSTITIHGGGFGHGVGLCQWGAMNMSKRGFKYYHILSKYFPGTILSKGY